MQRAYCDFCGQETTHKRKNPIIVHRALDGKHNTLLGTKTIHVTVKLDRPDPRSHDDIMVEGQPVDTCKDCDDNITRFFNDLGRP